MPTYDELIAEGSDPPSTPPSLPPPISEDIAGAPPSTVDLAPLPEPATTAPSPPPPISEDIAGAPPSTVDLAPLPEPAPDTPASTPTYDELIADGVSPQMAAGIVEGEERNAAIAAAAASDPTMNPDEPAATDPETQASADPEEPAAMVVPGSEGLRSTTERTPAADPTGPAPPADPEEPAPEMPEPAQQTILESQLNPIINNYRFQRDYQIHFTHVPTDTSIAFAAFLTSFDDNYSSTWASENVFGRYDPIHTFQQTTRTINFGFDVVAENLAEAILNLQDLRTVSRMLYPTYARDGFATTISKAPLIRIKFSNLIARGINATGEALLGKMNGFSIAPVIDPGFFDPSSELYPKAYSVSVAFDVLHEESPGAWPTTTVTTDVESQDTSQPAAADNSWQNSNQEAYAASMQPFPEQTSLDPTLNDQDGPYSVDENYYETEPAPTIEEVLYEDSLASADNVMNTSETSSTWEPAPDSSLEEDPLDSTGDTSDYEAQYEYEQDYYGTSY